MALKEIPYYLKSLNGKSLHESESHKWEDIRNDRLIGSCQNIRVVYIFVCKLYSVQKHKNDAQNS